jgi:cytochrome c
MRTSVTMMLALALLAACSKPQPPAETGNVAAPAAEAPPPSLTATQKKALLAELPAAYQSADLDNGQTKFAICKTCHTTAKGGENMTGPNLWGIFGRKAGTGSGFSYSDGLKSLGITWDADRIDHWIENPRADVSGTKMTYIGMASAKDRVDVVAYLKTVTSPAPAG